MTRKPSRTSRRAFLAALAAAPFAAAAQPSRSRARVACLFQGPESSAGGLAKRIESGLAAAGIANVELRLFNAASDDFGEMARSAAEAVSWGPDALLAPGPLHAVAARDATRTIPVVFFAVPDPEAFGLVVTLARPGRNVTGIGINAGMGTLKRLELAREVLPHARRLVSLYRRRPHSPVELIDRIRSRILEGGIQLKLQVEELEVGVGGRGLRATLATLAQRPPDALLPFGPIAWEPDSNVPDGIGTLLEFERRHRTLVIQESEHAVRRGAVAAMYDGGSQLSPAIAVLARVLKGASPAVTPVEFPLKFLLAVNPASARALGITLPPSVMLRADVVV